MTHAIGRWLAAFAILLASGAMPLLPSPSHAQTAGGLEILSVEYDPRSGLVGIQLRAAGSRDVPVEQLTVLVDAVPRTAVADEGLLSERPSALLAIDTSGSMNGTPIAAARNAAGVFLAQLSEDDPVGLLTFANEPILRVPVTPNGAQQRAALTSIVASGETALHDAIILALQTLADSPPPRALILLSDGEESGVSISTADQVHAAVDASDVIIHSFALGSVAPGEFLRDLSDRTGGSFWSVADDAALEQLFLALGGRIGASRSAIVRAPGLSAGEHQVTVRARVAGDLVESSVSFTVNPAVTLTVNPGAAAAPGDPLTFEVGVDATAVVNVTVSMPGVPGAASLAGSRIFVDPWVMAPGRYPLLVEARIAGNVVADETIEVTIPPLEPRLSVARTASGDWRATGRVQAGSALVATVDGQEVARTESASLTFTAPADGAVLEIRLEVANGTTALSESYNLQAQAAEGGASPVPLILTIAGVIVMVAGVLAWMRRPKKPSTDVRPLVRQLSAERITAPPADRISVAPSAWLHVTAPDGGVRQFPLGPRPLRAGTTDQADIRLYGPDIRPDHARFSLTPAGELRIHGTAERGARPYEDGTDDQWIMVRPGEEVAIGGWLFRLAADDSEQEAS